MICHAILIAPNMARFWIPNTLLTEMKVLATFSDPMETGGMLLGYVADNMDVVVSAIIGPGPNSSHSRYTFVPDAAYQQAELDRHYRATDGLETYLGDWHTHPGGQCIPSREDKRTLARIATTPSARIEHPVMAIAGYSTGRWELGVIRFQSVKRRIFSYAYDLERLTPIVYQPTSQD